MHCPPILSKLSITWALRPKMPSSNTENKPTGPAPTITASVLIKTFLTFTNICTKILS